MLNQLLSGHMNLPLFLTWIVALSIALTVHEFAHAWVADRAGDPTPRAHGRVSLNPLAHYDLIGTTAILLFGMGWGKPVPVNPLNFRRPRLDDIWVSLAGIIANLITATIFALLIRFGVAGIYRSTFYVIASLNLMLAFFNILPIYPLDGSHVLSNLLPVRQARKLGEFYMRWGLPMLMLLVFFGGRLLVVLVSIPQQFVLHLLLGNGLGGFFL